MTNFEKLVNMTEEEFHEVLQSKNGLTVFQIVSEIGPAIVARLNDNSILSRMVDKRGGAVSSGTPYAERELATRENPDWSYSRDPDTGAIWFDDESYVWFKLKYTS